MMTTNLSGTSSNKFQIGTGHNPVSIENSNGIIKFNNNQDGLPSSIDISDATNMTLETDNKTIMGAINELHKTTEHRGYTELFDGTVANGGTGVLSEPYTNYKKIVILMSYYNNMYYTSKYEIDTNLISLIVAEEDTHYFAHFFYNDSNIIPITFEFASTTAFVPHYAWGTISNLKVLGVT